MSQQYTPALETELYKLLVASLAAECIVYGIFTSLACASLWALYTRANASQTRIPMGVLISVMWTLATTHLAIGLVRAIHVFINSTTNMLNGVMIIVGYREVETFTAAAAIVGVQAILADIFLVWRCYVIWGKRWRIIIAPVILLVLEIALCVALILYTILGVNSIYRSPSRLETLASVTFAVVMLVNSLCSGLIAFRIWKVQRRVGHKNFTPVLAMIIESAVFYASALLCTVILCSSFAFGTGWEVMIAILPSLTGIVFSAIIIRVSLGYSSGADTVMHSAGGHPSAIRVSIKQSTVTESHSTLRDNDIVDISEERKIGNADYV